MQNNNGIPIVGEVDAYVTGTIDLVAHIDLVSQATLMAMVTVPKGKVGFLHRGSVSLGSGKEGVIDYMVRQKDKVFTIGTRIALYQNHIEADRPFIPIPELSDVEVRITPTQANTAVSANIGMVLLDLEYFDLNKEKFGAN